MKITKQQLRQVIKEEMDNQVTADDFNQISTGLRNLQRGVAREQRDEVMAIRKQLIALRKRVTGE